MDMPDIAPCNHGWRFAFTDACDPAAAPPAGWGEAVVLPHTWNADDMAPGRPQYGARTGRGTYRLAFDRRLAAGRRLHLRLDAVALRGEVRCDGSYLGGVEGGYHAARFDLTDSLAADGGHRLTVVADNEFRWGTCPPEPIDWHPYGGLHRDAWLEETGDAYLDFASLRVRAEDAPDSGTVAVSARIVERAAARRLELAVRIRDDAGAVVGEGAVPLASDPLRPVAVACRLPVPGMRRWSPAHPHLYRVEAVLRAAGDVLDRREAPCGLRRLEWDARRGFLLDGERIELRGVNHHQELCGLGSAVPAPLLVRDIEQMRAAGINCLRGAHYPRHDAVLAACDRLGILVIEEQPFWHGSLRREHGPGYPAYCRRMMRAMVEQHGNHPCIIAWNTVNEVLLTPHIGEPHPDPSRRNASHHLAPEHIGFARECLRAMHDELKTLDPGRATIMVLGGCWRQNVAHGFDRCADLVAHNGGAFNGQAEGRWVYDILRDGDPHRPRLMSEGILNDGERGAACRRGAWSHEMRFWEPCADHWQRIAERPWLCGGTMWVYGDYTAFGTERIMAMVDLGRLPYEVWYFFRAMWRDDEPVVHICGHWNRADEAGAMRTVTVFHSDGEVELLLDGASLGVGTSLRARWPALPRTPTQWQVPWRPGELRARLRRGGAIVAEHAVRTHGAPAGLRIDADARDWAADGRGCALVTIAACDADGELCRTIDAPLTLTLDGPGILGTAMPRELRGGLWQAAVRSLSQGGRVGLRASGAGCAGQATWG